MKVKTTKELVTSLLQEVPSNRDCDLKILANVWFYEAQAAGIHPNRITMMDFLSHLVDGKKFSYPTTVIRQRAIMQRKNPELRGETYQRRSKHNTKKSKNQQP